MNKFVDFFEWSKNQQEKENISKVKQVIQNSSHVGFKLFEFSSNMQSMQYAIYNTRPVNFSLLDCKQFVFPVNQC